MDLMNGNPQGVLAVNYYFQETQLWSQSTSANLMLKAQFGYHGYRWNG